MKLSTWIVIFFLNALPISIFADTLEKDPEVESFISRMVVKHAFSREELTLLLRYATIEDRVLKAFSRPAERKTWHEYRKLFITPHRIEGGREFGQKYKAALKRAENIYGVSPEVIVAIIGIETSYGKHTGNIRVLDALVTLGFRGHRRQTFFRRELEEFLELTRKEGLDPRQILGSYAGAIGIAQFIASSYRAYAIDFDGDGRRDLIGSAVDAIGSAANYLARHGWEQGGKVAVPVQLSGQAPQFSQGLKPNLSIGTMRRTGIEIAPSISDDEKGRLIVLETATGTDYWVGFQNFYAITQYNPSTLYAMAVHTLSTTIPSID